MWWQDFWTVAFPAWGFLSQLIMFVWAFRPDRVFKKYDWGNSTGLKKWAAVFTGISAFIGFVDVITEGYQSTLRFLPSSWGSVDDYGKWTTIRHTIAVLIAMIAAFGIINFLLKRNEYRRKQLETMDSDFISGGHGE